MPIFGMITSEMLSYFEYKWSYIDDERSVTLVGKDTCCFKLKSVISFSHFFIVKYVLA